MPNLIDILLDPVSLASFALYAVLILLEALFPARRLPAVAWWRLKGLTAFAVYFLLACYLPAWWGEHLAALQLFDLSGLGTWGGAAVGLLVYEAGAYAYHRGMHASDLLWRGLHQMHHSAERVDSFGAFWFSPWDMVGWILLASLSLTLTGITPEAGMVTMLATTFLAIFQHCNLRTPRWLGYLVQRPESHALHHGRGVHAGNYSDLPLFDLLFGSFRNPAGFVAENGFYEGASGRVGAMLVGRDVSRPALGGFAVAGERAV